VKFRQGRSVGRTLFLQRGDEPSDADALIGVMDTPDLAKTVVTSVNGRDRLLDALGAVLNEATRARGGRMDSQAMSAYADGLRLLAEYGRVNIAGEYGRRVIAEWVQSPESE
jgi:hypothetical protein